MAFSSATVKVSRYNAVTSVYELMRSQTVSFQQAEQLQEYLSKSMMIMQFYKVEIDYNDGTRYERYTSYADALGIVRSNDHQGAKAGVL